MMKKATQTAAVAAALKRKPLTYAEMAKAAGTINAHRRALEWEASNPQWRIDRRKNARGLVTWRIVRDRVF